MFYLITEQLVLLAERVGEDHEKAWLALKYLDLASQLGKHFVSAEHGSLFDRILKLDIQTTSFRESRNNYSFIANIAKTYHWHAEFIPSATPSSIDFNSSTVYISLNELSSFDIYRESQLLGEHLSDVRFYNNILGYFKRVHGLEKTHNCFHPLLGGGHTTSNVYKYECDNPITFILCITDSDYKYVGAALGDTAKAIKDIYKDKSPFNGIFYYLDGAREIENLIPISVYKKYAENPETGAKKKVDFIIRLFSCSPSLAPFFDFKEGINLYSISDSTHKNRIIEEVKQIIPDIDSRMIEDITKINEHNPGIKDEWKKKEMKKCVYIEGLGSRILEHILDSVNSDEIIDAMINYSSEFQRKEYETIGRLVYDWTASSGRKRL